MFYYTDGDLAFGDRDRAEAQREHLVNMLGAKHYPLRPDAVGKLHEQLGPADPDLTPQKAAAQIRRELDELGLSGLEVSHVLEVLDDSWQVALNVD